MGYIADDLMETATRLELTLTQLPTDSTEQTLQELFDKLGFEYAVAEAPRSDLLCRQIEDASPLLGLAFSQEAPVKILAYDQEGWLGFLLTNGKMLSKLVSELAFDFRLVFTPLNSEFVISIDDHDIVTVVGSAAHVLRSEFE